MSRLNIVTALLATCLVALWFTTSSAQDPHELCKQQCAARETLCLEACAKGGNPMECESDCRDEAWNCRTRC